ncbi:Eukaryotic elongation factor-2 kinase [Puccinia graminis f. sp. tritici]|uniref:Eukaryotic elongation factor-2 kinase n=1 Tax=Puccinia graminis f. sp. tritici TaxID=56615 RepID=A0A5B0PFE8_PUCGR|nr:Eukaryotic elongation factor-2 kinase [Puccinia graminis f. sp. tritici]
MAHLFSGTNPSPAPSTALQNLPPPHMLPSGQNSQIRITTAPSHNHSTTILNAPTPQTSLNVLKPPSNVSSPFPSHPNPTNSVPPTDSGSMAHFRRIVKEKRVKPSNSVPTSKRAKASVTAPTVSLPEKSAKHRDFGFLLYESDILVKNTGIHQIKQPYDLENPNLYNDLCTSLWAMFSPQILAKTHITSLPTNPEDYLCLSDGESRIPDQETLLGVLKEAKGRKVAHINLTYDHPFSGDDSNSDPTSSPPKRYPTRASTATASANQKTGGSSQAKKTKEPWALGPLAGTMVARGARNQSLASKMAFLSTPMPNYLNINSDGWLIAQRLVFDGIETSKATTESIIIKVNKQEIIGTGGMRTTYAAQVKTINEEVEIISEYVAKVMKDIQHQDLKIHAADARMYEACAVLLEEYRSVVQACRGLPMSTKGKATKMQASSILTSLSNLKLNVFHFLNSQIIRHSVVFTGDIHFPTNIYFFEKRLVGNYVKYSSNTKFNIPINQNGMDPKLAQLMNTFTHWTYNTSKGKNLVADLQGVGPLITDPQIIDLDEK